MVERKLYAEAASLKGESRQSAKAQAKIQGLTATLENKDKEIQEVEENGYISNMDPGYIEKMLQYRLNYARSRYRSLPCGDFHVGRLPKKTSVVVKRRRRTDIPVVGTGLVGEVSMPHEFIQGGRRKTQVKLVQLVGAL